MRSALFVLLIVLVIGLLHLWVKNKSYVFDQDTIFDITRKAIAKLNTTGTVLAVIALSCSVHISYRQGYARTDI